MNIKNIKQFLLSFTIVSIIVGAISSAASSTSDGCQCTNCTDGEEVCGANISAEARLEGNGDKCWRCAVLGCD